MFATYRKDDPFQRPVSRHRTLYGATKRAGKTLAVGLLIEGQKCRPHRDPTPRFTVESDNTASTVPYFGPCMGEPSDYCRDELVQRWHVKHGGFLDRDVCERALNYIKPAK